MDMQNHSSWFLVVTEELLILEMEENWEEGGVLVLFLILFRQHCYILYA